LRELGTRHEQYLFLDESSKDRVAAVRKYGRSAKGTKASVRSLFNMDTRYTFLGAAGSRGFVPEACDVVMHKVDGKEESDPLTADRYVEYIEEKVLPILGNWLKEEDYSIVVMDNCSIHIDERVRAAIESKGAMLVPSAPYSPDLIPIESMFAQYKAYLKLCHLEFAIDAMKVHREALNVVSVFQGLKYFKMTTLVELVEDDILIHDPKFMAAFVVLIQTNQLV